jgi:transposase InsO family protein
MPDCPTPRGRAVLRRGHKRSQYDKHEVHPYARFEDRRSRRWSIRRSGRISCPVRRHVQQGAEPSAAALDVTIQAKGRPVPMLGDPPGQRRYVARAHGGDRGLRTRRASRDGFHPPDANPIRRPASRGLVARSNAVAESFWATLKRELATSWWPTRAAARQAVFEYIEILYNDRRLHGTLGMLTPSEYEQAHYAALNPEPQPA